MINTKSYKYKTVKAFVLSSFLILILVFVSAFLTFGAFYSNYVTSEVENEFKELNSLIDYSKNVNGILNPSAITKTIIDIAKVEEIQAYFFNKRGELISPQPTEKDSGRILTEILDEESSFIDKYFKVIYSQNKLYSYGQFELKNNGIVYGTAIIIKEASYLFYFGQALLAILLVSTLLGSVAIGIAAIKFSNYFVGPVDQLSKELNQIKNIEALKEIGIKDENLPTEISNFTTILNRLTTKIKNDHVEKDKLFKALAHGLKTPLTIINSSADLIAKQDIDPNEAVLTIKNEVKELTKLINYYITTAKIKNDNELKTVILGDVLLDVIEKYKNNIANKSADIKVILTNLKISSNEKLVYIMLDNLISNSVEHSPSNSQINITLEEKDSVFSLIIQNDVNLKKKWEEDKSSKYGLKIVDEICQTLGWKHTAESTNSKYTATVFIYN